MISSMGAELRSRTKDSRFSMPDKRPTNCSHCTKPTTIHLTQIVDGKVKKLNMCQQCPHAMKATEAGSIDIVAPSKSTGKAIVHGIRPVGKGVTCPKCGLTQETFKEFGRLGCPTCYDVFATELEAVLRKAHRGVEHKGKRPAKLAQMVSDEEIAALKRKLQESVEVEDYEQAALLRDRIMEIESRVA